MKQPRIHWFFEIRDGQCFLFGKTVCRKFAPKETHGHHHSKGMVNAVDVETGFLSGFGDYVEVTPLH